MTVVAIALVGALVVAVACGGRPKRLMHPPFVHTGYLMLAVAAQGAALLSKHLNVMIMWLLLGVVGLVVYWRSNRSRPGHVLMIAGLALNALVVILNSGQPVSVAAAQYAGLHITAESLAGDPLALAIDGGTLLPWLGQVIPVPIPHWSTVASPGDLLAAAGAAVYLFTGLTGFGRTIPKTPQQERQERKEQREAKRDQRLANDSVLEGEIITAGASATVPPEIPAAVATGDAAAAPTAVAGATPSAAAPDKPRLTPEEKAARKAKKAEKRARRDSDEAAGSADADDADAAADGRSNQSTQSTQAKKQQKKKQKQKQARKRAKEAARAASEADASGSDGSSEPAPATSIAAIRDAIAAAAATSGSSTGSGTGSNGDSSGDSNGSATNGRSPAVGDVARAPDPTEGVDTTVWHDRAAVHLSAAKSAGPGSDPVD